MTEEEDDRIILEALRLATWVLVELERTEPELRNAEHLGAVLSLHVRKRFRDLLRIPEDSREEAAFQVWLSDTLAELLQEARSEGRN